VCVGGWVSFSAFPKQLLSPGTQANWLQELRQAAQLI